MWRINPSCHAQLPRMRLAGLEAQSSSLLVGVRVSYEKQFSADFMAHAIMLHSFSAKLR